MNDIRLLMMDLGLVLIDLEIENFHQAVYRKTGENHIIANRPLHHRYMAGEFTEKQLRQILMEKYNLSLSAVEFPDFWSQMLGKDRSEVISLVRKAGRKFKTAVCSNTDATHIDFLKREQSKAIGFFDYYCYSFEMGVVKPDPTFFKKALNITGFQPQNCLFIDDNEENIITALKMGINAVHTPKESDVIKALNGLLEE